MSKTKPKIPPSLWMLWSSLTNDWVVPIDAPNGGENYIVCTSLKDARAAAKHQNDTYQLRCKPVQVKGGAS